MTINNIVEKENMFFHKANSNYVRQKYDPSGYMGMRYSKNPIFVDKYGSSSDEISENYEHPHHERENWG